MKLTPKERLFVNEYFANGFNAKQAYKSTYKCSDNVAAKHACDVTGRPRVREYIDKKLKELESAKIATQKEVLETLTAIMRGEVKQEQLITEGRGEGCSEAVAIEVTTPVRERAKAAELLGKVYGVFTEKLEVSDSKVVIKDDIE